MAAGELYDIVWIVVSFNSAYDISRCIDSIRRHFAVGEITQAIVIVDNASADDTREKIENLGKTGNLKTIYLDRNVGFGAANNVAFSEFSARYYILINADAWLIADSVSPAIATMDADSRIVICGLPLIFPDGSPQTHAYRQSSGFKWFLQLLGLRRMAKLLIGIPGITTLMARFQLGREYVRSMQRKRMDLEWLDRRNFDGVARPVDWVCGAAMIVRGTFIRECGGFDQGMFLYGEDEDLCIEAKKRGQNVVTVNVPPVVHRFGWGKSKQISHAADLKYRSMQYFINKNITGKIGRLFARVMLPFHVYGLFHFYRAWWKEPKN